ncbi:SPW repeat protein [Streptomyces sp. NPDC048142]|uniref:SPW repeat domain-containing protein n=1 Tax=Streptomyces sp. NPDC048142 TaxID=3365501 RepID=UPI003710FDF6
MPGGPSTPPEADPPPGKPARGLRNEPITVLVLVLAGGVWLIVAPFVVSYGDTDAADAARVNDIAVGCVLIVLSFPLPGHRPDDVPRSQAARRSLPRPSWTAGLLRYGPGHPSRAGCCRP